MKKALFILVLAACRNESPAMSPDAPVIPADAFVTHTWNDAYTLWATGSCTHSLTCDPDWFNDNFVDMDDCIAQTVSSDCESAAGGCEAIFPAAQWPLVEQCLADFQTLSCSQEWPAECITALQ